MREYDDENDVVKEIAPLDQLFSGIWERKSRRRRKKDLLKFGWFFGHILLGGCL